MVDHHKKDHSEISLDEWFRTHTSDDERKELFIYMDKALKYIHKNKYCVGIFHPSRIFILNDDVRYIQFLDLVEMPEDDYELRDIVNQDLFFSSYIQIGLYFGRFLNRTFLIENADQVLANVPEYAVAYYKGILNGASVYFSDYCFEKDKSALMQFKKEFEDAEDKDDSSTTFEEIESPVKEVVESNPEEVSEDFEESDDYDDEFADEEDDFDDFGDFDDEEGADI
jgi:hypothetical protein